MLREQLTVRLLPPFEDSNPMSHFLGSVTDLFEYALRNCSDSDMVGITFSNEVNVQDKAVGIRFRRKDQLTRNVIWSIFGKVSQSNARFNALDKLEMVVHSVKWPSALDMSLLRVELLRLLNLKRGIVEVKAEDNCSAHALIISIAKLMIQSTIRIAAVGRYVL